MLKKPHWEVKRVKNMISDEWVASEVSEYLRLWNEVNYNDIIEREGKKVERKREWRRVMEKKRGFIAIERDKDWGQVLVIVAKGVTVLDQAMSRFNQLKCSLYQKNYWFLMIQCAWSLTFLAHLFSFLRICALDTFPFLDFSKGKG